MSSYLLDTSVLIDYSKRREPAFSVVHRLLASRDAVWVCPIVVAEFLSAVAPADRPRWDTFFDTLAIAPLTYDVAAMAGEYRYVFARQGISILLPDAMIADVARSLSATLVTTNAKDFPMSDIDTLVP